MTLSADRQDEFERLLLASARSDAEPSDVEQAWARFAGVLQAVGVPSVPERGEADALVPRAPVRAVGHALAVVRAARRVRGLIASALGVAGLTAAVFFMRPERERARVRSFEPARETVREPPRPVERPPASGHAIEPARHAPGIPARSAAKHRRASASARRQAEPAPGGGLAPSAGLAVEVERIETARRTAAAGDYEEAIRIVERYHHDFPESVLRPDAEVVALEAAAAHHDVAETRRRAARFLSLYPNDPHAARVRWLVEHP